MPRITPSVFRAFMAAIITRKIAAQCTFTGEISKFTGDCTFDNFNANLVGCTLAELFADPQTAIAELCKYDAPVQFVEINGYYQLDRRYMDGGGPLIDSLDPFSVEAGRILRFDANAGSSTLIGWPEYAALVDYNAQELLGDHGYPSNFDLVNSCDLNTVMCCYIDDAQGSGFGEDSTTDVCRHDLSNSPQSNHIKDGWSVFPNSETSTHCVGFTWEDGTDSDTFKGNALFDISLRTTATKGYYKSIPGAPLCACIEQMPVVEKADCRTAVGGPITYTFHYNAESGVVSASNTVDVTYSDCGNLADHFKSTHSANADAIDAHLVGTCDSDVADYLNNVQFLVEGAHPTKYLDITEADGWAFVAGEGIRFLPPDINAEIADTNFRNLIDGGCKNPDNSSRYCIIRRFCDSCSSDIHRDIYYKRITPIPDFGTGDNEVYLLDLFLNNWASTPANLLHVDFELYSTYEDALSGTNPWQFCNYDDPQVGFPRDCNRDNWAYGGQWNSYVKSGATANHHGFYVEKP